MFAPLSLTLWGQKFPGRHWISTGTGRWDRPAATPEVYLEDFAEVGREGGKLDGLAHVKFVFFCLI